MTEEEKTTPQSASKRDRRRKVAVFGPALAAFSIATGAAAMAAYRFGEGVIYVGDRTISDLTFFEVTGNAALGVLGAVIALAAAAVGAVGALIATIVGVSVGFLGLVLGAVVAIGVVTGPVLLVTLVAILIKRRYWPDVI